MIENHLPAELPAVSVPEVIDDEATFLKSWDKARLPISCSWDDSTDEGRKLALRCFTSPDFQLSDVPNVTITVHKLAIFRQKGKVGDGEEAVEKWKAALIDQDGAILRFASPPALDSLREIVVSHGGIHKVAFPFSVKVVTRPGANSGNYYLLEEV